jgi:hypothetical protein
MHKLTLCDVVEVESALEQLDADGDTIVSSFYCSDSQQVGIISNGKRRKKLDVDSAMKRIFKDV